MMDFRIALAGVSIVMTLVGYTYYFRDIFAGKTKPHAFSWLVWGSLTSIGFAGQLSDHGGPGSWVTGLTAAVCVIIFALAIKKGEKNITLSDKLNLLGAGLALLLWFFTSSPLSAIILICIIDFLGFLPTIRKSFYKPYEETFVHYVLAGLKFVLAIAALNRYTIVTWLYPASLVIGNLGFAAMLAVRRKQLAMAD